MGGMECVYPAIANSLSREDVKLLDFLFYYTSVDFNTGPGGRPFMVIAAQSDWWAFSYLLTKGAQAETCLAIKLTLEALCWRSSRPRQPRSTFATLYFAADYRRNELLRMQVQSIPFFKKLVDDELYMQQANLYSLRIIRPEKLR